MNLFVGFEKWVKTLQHIASEMTREMRLMAGAGLVHKSSQIFTNCFVRMCADLWIEVFSWSFELEVLVGV